MLSPEQFAEGQRRKAYWKRNAFSTCIVLLVVVAASALIYPLSPWLVVACLTAGSFIFLAELAADHTHGLVALSLIVASLGIFLSAVIAANVLDGPLLWAQGIASFGAGALGARVIHEHLSAA